MKLLTFTAALTGIASCAFAATSENTKPLDAEGLKQYLEGSYEVAATCFKNGEATSGMNKICFYNCLGSTVAINVKSYQLCPLSIQN